MTANGHSVWIYKSLSGQFEIHGSNCIQIIDVSDKNSTHQVRTMSYTLWWDSNYQPHGSKSTSKLTRSQVRTKSHSVCWDSNLSPYTTESAAVQPTHRLGQESNDIVTNTLKSKYKNPHLRLYTPSFASHGPCILHPQYVYPCILIAFFINDPCSNVSSFLG